MLRVRNGSEEVEVKITEDMRRKARERVLKRHELGEEIMNAEDNEVDEKIKAYLAFGKSHSHIGGGLFFARVEWSDWEEIKRTPTDELKKQYINLSVCLNFCFSVRDCQMQDLLAVELKRRKVDFQELTMEIEKGIKAAEDFFEQEVKHELTEEEKNQSR